MKLTANRIGAFVSTQLLERKCVVLVPNCYWTGYEADVLGVTRDLRVIDVEVKISRSDFKADAAKDKWWHSLTWQQRADGAERQRREWPPRVWKHYFAVPETMWKPELESSLPSARSGVVLIAERGTRLVARVAKRAEPNRDAARISAEAVLDIARLANLRMWSALETRD